MKNMKQILRAFSALGMTAVAGATVVACAKPANAMGQVMPDQVLADLGLKTKTGDKFESAIDGLTLTKNDNDVSFSSPKVNNKNAADLVGEDNKAKSQESFDFLKAFRVQLKSGTKFEDATFDKTELANLKLKATKYSPTFAKNKGSKDYYLNGGSVNVSWEAATISLSKYTVDLKPQEETGTFVATNATFLFNGLSTLPNNAVSKDGPLENFKVGNPVINPAKNSDITNNLLDTDSNVKLVKSFVELMKKNNVSIELSAKVKEATDSTDTSKTAGNWVTGDKLVVTFTLGTVTKDISIPVA